MALPLHIFEERYKLMIGQAIEQNSEFGVVLAKENSLANVGCTAAVEKVVQRYADGRLDILGRGRRRFEVLFLDEEKPYLRGGVHFFDDEQGAAPAEAAVLRLARLFERVLGFLPNPAAPASKEGLDSFQIAGVLPLDLDLKQRLLCLRSETERVAALSEFLEKLLPRMELAQRVEKSAKGNGRGR